MSDESKPAPAAEAAGSPVTSPSSSSPQSPSKGSPLHVDCSGTRSPSSPGASPLGSPLSGKGPGGRRPTLAEPSWPGARVILLALDTSDNAKKAFDWYMEHIFRPDDVLVLAHCPETPKLPTLNIKSGFAPPVAEWKKILDDMNSKARRLEEEYEETCIHKKLRYKVRGEASKQPGEGIVKIAEEEDVSMVVMGTRGIGGIKRALLGSVTDYVSRHVTVPVILVPSRDVIDKRLRSSSMSDS